MIEEVHSIDEHDEAAGENLADRKRPCLSSSISECSDPDLWQQLHHGCEEKVKFEGFL